MATIDEFLTSLRNEFGEQAAGKKFEVFCKWFLENDPEWSKKIDRVWLWDDYPDKWQREDLGTDLVFLDKGGLIWAVQAKCYSEDRSTIKKHMNSFLADSGRKQVHRRLWIQTTNKMEAKAVKTLTGQDKPVTVFSLRDFHAAQIDYPSSYSELYQAEVKDKPTPDTHQIEAIKAVKSKLQSLDRGQMIMACGTGKTFTTLWIKEALNAQSTLVLLPSLSLLSQTMREWAWAGNDDFDILNVCSDKSVGKKTEDMDPSDTPFPVTSEVDEIARFIKAPKPKVIFCTYQSSSLIAEAQMDARVPAFDLTIADEAHRCAGKADAGFATVLNAQKIRSSKRLFTTATPRYFGKAVRDESKVRDVAVVGMNDESVFGPVIHMLSFGEAIRRELLTDYQVVIVCVDEPMIKQWIDDDEIVSINSDEHTDARTLAAKIGLIKAIKDYDLKRVISFHSRVARAKEFSEELVDLVDLIDPIHRPKGLFLADYVSGEMKAGDRKDKIDRLKILEGYDRGVLTNARCLAEGVDVPSLDGVAFIDPKGSQVEIIQAVGRAIRKVRGIKIQTKGTIVIPVFVEDCDDPEESIEASNFKPVWEVLKALRAHDEELAITLDKYRTDMGKIRPNRPKDIIDKIILDLPMAVDAGFSNALSAFLVEATTASWEFWFGLLLNYQKKHGDCNVVGSHVVDDEYKLGSWVQEQRKQKRLTSHRKDRLDALGFIWDMGEYEWDEGFKVLANHIKQNGTSRFAYDFRANGINMMDWVGTQRKNKVMPNARIEQLNKIGFSWDPQQDKFDFGFETLKEYKLATGHCQPHATAVHNNFKLGTWCSSVRDRNKRGILSKENIKRLADIGFIWDQIDNKFESNVDELNVHISKYGGSLPPKDLKLRNWTNALRKLKRDGALSFDKIKKIEAIGFDWDPLTSQWEEGFNSLVSYKAEFGDCLVSTYGLYEYKDYKLGSWVSVQRSGKDKLSLERFSRLDELGFDWDPFTSKWEQGFEFLVSYKAEFGDCLVAAGTEYKGYKLWSWVGMQRKGKDKLSLERFSRLDELGFDWDPFTSKWEQGFEFLVSYKAEFGDCLVAAGTEYKGYKLWSWVGMQRKGKDKLSLERFSRLDELGFDWDPFTSKWEQGFEFLVSYKAEFGDCLVAAGTEYKGYKLWSWVGMQRKGKDKLSLERFSRLDELGFDWDPLKSEWENKFQCLVSYKAEFGDCLVAGDAEYQDYKLGSWVSVQRKSKGKLIPERVNRLDELGFVWDVLTSRWEEKFKCLIAYKAEFGHFLIAKGAQYQGLDIGDWSTKLRKNKDKLEPGQVSRLDELGFDWDPLKSQWEEKFKCLVSYKVEFGDCSVAKRRQYKNHNLGEWVGRLRRSKAKLSLDQISRLDELGFVWKLK